eukprot:3351199-Rhodomonas_salina.1
MAYDLAPFLVNEQSALYYPEVSMVLRLWKWGCTQSQCSPDNLNGDECDLRSNAITSSCNAEGNMTINAVPCWDGRLDYDTQARLLRTVPKREIGRILVDRGEYFWLEIPLDVEIVRDWALEYGKKLCLNVEAADGKLNETIVLYGGTADTLEDPNEYNQRSDFGKRIGWPTHPNPELLIIRGRAWNCTGPECDVDCTGQDGTNVYSDACIPSGSKAPIACGKFQKCEVCCELNMTGGTGKRNKRVRFTSFIDPANILLDAIDYNIEGMYSNAQGIEKEN